MAKKNFLRLEDTLGYHKYHTGQLGKGTGGKNPDQRRTNFQEIPKIKSPRPVSDPKIQSKTTLQVNVDEKG